jgi:putative ABC transport system ATP-binding protein
MRFEMVRVCDLSMRLTSGGRPVTILDRVSFGVAAGEFVAITGPSGSGKSTLLGLVAGLDQPTAGTVEVDGVDITRLSEDALAGFRRQRIGYVFQSYQLIPTLSAAENVAVPRAGRRRGCAGGGATCRRGRACRPRSPYPSQLSGRAARGAGPGHGPQAGLLLTDEPTQPRLATGNRHHQADVAAATQDVIGHASGAGASGSNREPPRRPLAGRTVRARPSREARLTRAP